MNRRNDGRLGERQEIVVALEVAGPVREALAAEFHLAQAPALNHRPHRAVEDHQPPPEKLEERLAIAHLPLEVHSGNPGMHAAECGRRPSAWQMAYVSSARFSV